MTTTYLTNKPIPNISKKAYKDKDKTSHDSLKCVYFYTYQEKNKPNTHIYGYILVCLREFIR